jgi:uncharacterized protein YqgC (DUF456 family)
MSVLSVLAYGADAAVLATYWHLARTGSARLFHWANAIGCLPLIGVELVAHLYQPLILSVAFGIIGALGVWKDHHASQDHTQA